MTTTAMESPLPTTRNRQNEIIYWVSTGLIGFIWLFSTVIMLTPAKVEAMARLGFPDYFRIELIAAKVFGLIALLLPRVPVRIKEWAYAGYGIILVSASVAHWHAGDPLVNVVEPLTFLVILAVSNVYLHKMNPA
jgi:DoxX-like protein